MRMATQENARTTAALRFLGFAAKSTTSLECSDSFPFNMREWTSQLQEIILQLLHGFSASDAIFGIFLKIS
jgi:hypothetical protein